MLTEKQVRAILRNSGLPAAEQKLLSGESYRHENELRRAIEKFRQYSHDVKVEECMRAHGIARIGEG